MNNRFILLGNKVKTATCRISRPGISFLLAAILLIGLGSLIHGQTVKADVTTWSQQAKLTASNAAAGDMFGTSVAIDGDTMVIGAPEDDDAGTSSGSAYVFIRSDSSWIQQAKLTANDAAIADDFGYSVAISEDTVVVGTPDAGFNSGSAYVFTRSGNIWSQQAKLTASDATMEDHFGWSVAISGDAIAVGAPDARFGSGTVYVFNRSGSTWSQQAKLTASDAAIADRFGHSVAISEDTVVVGALYDDNAGDSSGSAYVFVYSDESWSQQYKLAASDATDNDMFGNSVAISGDTVVVGAHRDADMYTDSGSAYVFTRTGPFWNQQAKLTASDAAVEGHFGWSVAISSDMVIVGAYGDDNAGTYSGSAYVFIRSDSSWSQQYKLAASDAASDDMFGRSVAVSEDTVVVGAPYDDDAGDSSGSAYVYITSPDIGFTAAFSATPTSGNEPLTVIFTDLSTSYDNIESWLWDFGDGQLSTEQSPEHEYTHDGTYTISLTITEADSDSSTDMKADYITVSDPGPTAAFSATPLSEDEPLTMKFTDTSTSYDGIVYWVWEFGDGQTSTAQSPEHEYAQDGTYTISLTVTEADDDSSTETKTGYIIINESPAEETDIWVWLVSILGGLVIVLAVIIMIRRRSIRGNV